MIAYRVNNDMTSVLRGELYKSVKHWENIVVYLFYMVLLI